MIAVGVQTWGTDVAALRRYWAAADALGYARVTYGDGLWDFTHDGWTLLAALALQTRTCRIGPAVTYAFAAAAHHRSWLAKRAVAIGPRAMALAALVAAGRPGEVVRRSLEVDAALADAPHEAARAAERFRAHRGLARDHPLLDAALVGDAEGASWTFRIRRCSSASPSGCCPRSRRGLASGEETQRSQPIGYRGSGLLGERLGAGEQEPCERLRRRHRTSARRGRCRLEQLL